ncbi:MAG: hypothetical protein HYZ75_04375 [Elusimicrobia bacterium]|nr:hypothetical protein [Elusimicrobiota bacterium]
MRRAAAAALALAWLAAACKVRPAPVPPAPVPAAGRLALLEDVLQAKNDNDPRLDSAFSALSEEEKIQFRAKYRAMPAESRNERGTVVYLLGQNLASADDWGFLREVAGEEPCLSLLACTKGGRAGPGDEVTLAYPALVALKRAEAALEAGESVAEARAVIAAAEAAGAPAAARLAERLQKRFP